MKSHGLPVVKEGSVNVTPLIDIVMCLIIFFMLVTKICIDDGRGSIDLPETSVGAEIDDLANSISLNIHEGANGTPLCSVLDPKLNRVEDKQVVPAAKDQPSEIEAFIREVRGDNREFKVVVRADKSLSYKFIGPVIIALNKCQVTEISLATAIEMVRK